MSSSPPPLMGRRRGYGPLLLLSQVRLPCDREAAALAAEEAASTLRRSYLASAGVAFVFIAVMLWFAGGALPGFPAAPGVGLFILFFLAVALGLVASIVYGVLRTRRMAGELAGLAKALRSGLLAEEDYCDKTLYQALLTYRARTPGIPR